MNAASSDTTELRTIRDFLRWGVSRFNAADLVYGHGTENALDEAAFLILETLRLPIDKLDPFLDARLTALEREAVTDIIDLRVDTRKPAPYLTGSAYIQGIRFLVDERVLIPRSFVGELLADGSLTDGLALIDDPDSVEAVLDIGTGSGCLAILAALAFPNAQVDAVDVSPGALEVARTNVSENGLDARIRLAESDLFSAVTGRRYDLIIANPPYVDADDMAALPREYRHEPMLALAGGPDGLDIVRRLLDEVGDFLNPCGGLLCEIGTGREILDAAFPHLSLLWLDSEQSSGEVFWISAEGLHGK